MQSKIKIWDLENQEQEYSHFERLEELTSTMVDTTITFIGAFKVVRAKNYLLHYGWIFLAVACFGLAMCLMAIK